MTTPFTLEQRFAAPLADVEGAFVDADFYRALGTLPTLGEPVVLDRTDDGDVVRLRVAYRFTGELSPAARAMLDPSRLSWVDESEHDLARHVVRFRLVPDHYGDRFRCQGEYRFETAGAGTRRVASGEVTVRTPLVGRTVERAIVSGLRGHLSDEVDVLERWLGGELAPG